MREQCWGRALQQRETQREVPHSMEFDTFKTARLGVQDLKIDSVKLLFVLDIISEQRNANERRNEVPCQSYQVNSSLCLKHAPGLSFPTVVAPAPRTVPGAQQAAGSTADRMKTILS